MKIAVIGSGYVGLVSGICLASLGHQINFYDNDSKKVADLKAGIIPIYEPGLKELLERHAENIVFSDDLSEALKESKAILLCVGTPTIKETGEADLQYVFAATHAIKAKAEKGSVLITKSTVPVGTNRQLAEILSDDNISVASNPEFLREGSAIKDFMSPDRIVIGSDNEETIKVVKVLYTAFAKLNVPFVITEWETAEMIKYAANTFLAAKVAFINEMADLCETIGADVDVVSYGIGLDPRIGSKFLKAGPGFGGSCFPKDTKALLKIADKQELSLPITEAVVTSNENRRYTMVGKIINAFGGSIAGKTIAILGLTFKPGTDDMRESVSLVILPELISHRAKIQAYDPEGMNEAKKLLPAEVRYCASAKACLEGADGAVIITEWDEFKTLGNAFSLLKEKIVVDLRNILNAQDLPNIKLVSVGKQNF